MRVLSLASNCIQNEGIRILDTFLRRNSMILTLNLSDNNIGYEGNQNIKPELKGA